jgi:hypothetical protein
LIDNGSGIETTVYIKGGEYDFIDAIMTDITGQAGCGYDILLNLKDKTFDFYILEIDKTDIVLSKTWGDVTEQEYIKHKDNYKTFLYFEDSETGISDSVGGGIGLERYEYFVSSATREEANLDLETRGIFEGVLATPDPNFDFEKTFKKRPYIGTELKIKDPLMGFSMQSVVRSIDVVYELGNRTEILKLT